LKGRSSSHREFLIVVLLSLPGFLLAGAGGKIFTNGWLDTSTEVVRETIVAHSWISTSDDDTSYHVEVRSWREGRTVEHLRVSEFFYRQLPRGEARMSITTRSGKWGWEWIEDYSLP
jgi:hypothetical protein